MSVCSRSVGNLVTQTHCLMIYVVLIIIPAPPPPPIIPATWYQVVQMSKKLYFRASGPDESSNFKIAIRSHRKRSLSPSANWCHVLGAKTRPSFSQTPLSAVLHIRLVIRQFPSPATTPPKPLSQGS